MAETGHETTPTRLANAPLAPHTVYLHHPFDLWVNVWRQKWAQGEVIVVRYADDIVLGFQYQTDADRFRDNLVLRLKKFGLELHPDKTRRIEFGRFAEPSRRREEKASQRRSISWASSILAGRAGTGNSP